MNHLKKFINYITNVIYLNKATSIIEILEKCQNANEKIETFAKVEKWLCKDLVKTRKFNTELIAEKKSENDVITNYLGLNTPVSISMMNVDFDEPIKNV